MDTRTSKYLDNETNRLSRVHRNEELYKEINKSELENFDIKSNATILGNNDNEIDVEKIKKILDTKYNEIPKRRSIRLEQEDIVEERKEDTKEYDINVILEKAKENKEVNYEEERLKKLRNTQFNILKNLDLNKKEEVYEEDENLKTLINTITYNEKHHKEESSPLDILSDLKGSDNTETLEGLKEEVDNKIEEEKTDLTNSFYTSSNSLTTDDFEDMEEFSKSIESNNMFMKIVIALIVIIFIAGVYFLIKTLIL